MKSASAFSSQAVPTLGVVGVGAMGAGMASRLLAAGFELHVLDGHSKKAVDSLSSLGKVRRHSSIQELADSSLHILTCLPTAQQVLAAAASLPVDREGRRTLIDCSTVGLKGAADIYREVASRGWQYVDAPVTGGPQRAMDGDLLCYFASGDRPHEGVMEIVRTFASRVVELDKPGNGQLLKLANNVILLGLAALNGYALTFAQSLGISPAQFAEIVRGGAADNWQLQNYLPKALEPGAVPGFSLQLAYKDLELVLAAARDSGLDTAVLDSIKGLYESATRREQEAGERSDFSAIIRELASPEGKGF